VAYDSNGMSWELSRRWLLRIVSGGALIAGELRTQTIDQQNPPSDDRLKLPDNNDDQRLPDGRSQKNAIAKQQHERALRDADELCGIAGELREELRKAGDFVVPVSAVKKTEEIEKIAKRIRGRLKY
jgi:hypothetical protein